MRRRWRRHDGNSATGDEVDDDGDGTMSDGDDGARRAMKLTMMATTTTMATGGSDDDDDGDGATGYDDTMAMARRVTKSTMTMATAQ